MRRPQADDANNALLETGEQLHHSTLLHHDPCLDCSAHNSGRHLRHDVQKTAKLNLCLPNKFLFGQLCC